MSEPSAKDWVGNSRTHAFAWGAPSLAIITGSLVVEPARTVIWLVALIWMGTACLVNSHRCGRTHCRFTGPYYLILAIPVFMHGFGLFFLGSYAWWVLGAMILLGGKLIAWYTDAVWGKFWES